MSTSDKPSYVSLTIEPGAERIQLSDSMVGILAQAVNWSPELLRRQLETGPVKLSKVRVNKDLEVLIAALKKSGLSVTAKAVTGEKSTGHAVPPSDKAVRSGLSLPSSRADMDLNWKKGQVIEGTYEVLGSAMGGMGKVYFVFHRLWKMNMAIKTPHRAAVKSETRMVRFLREAEFWVDLGLHPNIATCYYARVIDGIPRLFIEYVDGGDLHSWNLQKRLDDLVTVTDLMLQFCHGMMYAESRGMIHRDIKPANCLITHDKILKITDFGLVKRVDDSTGEGKPEEAVSDPTRLTETSVTLFEAGVMGSPWYMAPERFLDKRKDDIRSDIYSFGVMFYELAVGSKPFKFPKGFSLPALVRSHLHRKPVDPTSIRPDLPRKLVEIISTCLKKKAENRYPSFADLCRDLEVAAGRMGAGRKPRPRPNLVGLKANSLNNQAVSLLDLGRTEEAIQLLEDAHSANTDHLEAVYNLHTLRWIRGELSDREVSNRMESLRIEVRETADYYHLMGLVCLQKGDATRGVTLLEKACKAAGHYRERWSEFKEGPRGFVKSLRLKPIAEQGSLAGHIKSVRALGFSPRSEKAFSVGEDRSIRVWDVDTGRCLKNLRTFTFVPVAGAFSPDGKAAVTAYGDSFKTLDVWDLDGGKLRHRHQGMGVFGVCFSRDSRYVAALGTQGSLWIIDMSRQEIVRQFPKISRGISSVTFLGDSQTLVLGEDDGNLALMRLDDSEPFVHIPAHKGRISCLDVSNDNTRILTGGADETVRIWNAVSGAESLRFTGHSGNLIWARFLADNGHVASASSDGTIRIWDLAGARCYRTISQHAIDLTACTVSRDGKRLLSGGARGALSLWSLDTGWFEKSFLEPAICQPRTFNEMALLYDYFNSSVQEFRTFWSAGNRPKALKVFERIQGSPGFCWSREAIEIRNLLQKGAKRGKLKSWSFIRSFRGHTDTVVSVDAAQDGLTLLTGSLDGTAASWDVVTGRCIKRFDLDSPVARVLYLPHAKGILAWSTDNTARIWDLEGNLLQQVPDVLLPIGLSASGVELVAMSQNSEPLRINLDNGRRISKGAPILCDEFVCFSQALDTVYSLRDGTRIQRWSASTGRNVGSFRDLSVRITALHPTATNDRVLAGTETGDVIVYIAGSGINVATLRGHTAPVRTVALAKDGRHWITGSDDCSLRLWDLKDERCTAVMEGHATPIRAVCFFPNMSLAASSGLGGSVRLWGLEWELAAVG